jgi:hypothetical protein
MRHGAKGCLADAGGGDVRVATCEDPLPATQRWDFVKTPV